MKKILLYLSAALFLCLGVYIIAFYQPSLFSQRDEPYKPLFSPQEPITTNGEFKPHREAPRGYREYYDTVHRFSLFYPETLEVKTYDEGEGAVTIVFQDAETASGFQMFITPYGLSQVTAERFRRDVPSGVQENLKSRLIDGVTGASFYSQSPVLGETHEVWFIHGGFLFEMTTLKALEAPLDQIIETFRFI